MNIKILIVEDEVDISDGLALYLRHNGLEVHQSFNGKEALSAFFDFEPHIILLDTILPDVRGPQLCVKFKEKSSVGIIFLTALSEKDNVINAFNCGADDYITKPFDMEILLSRITALVNRMDPLTIQDDSDIYHIRSSITFDMYRNDIIHNDNYANLTITEFKILYYLASKSTYCSVSELIGLLYGSKNSGIHSRTISVHIANIRKKLVEIERTDIKIRSKYKAGYIVMLSSKEEDV